MYHLDQDALEDCRFRSKNQTFFRNHILPSELVVQLIGEV
jgi:hypothetical protein